MVENSLPFFCLTFSIKNQGYSKMFVCVDFRSTAWGNPHQLREALDAVWSHLLGNPLTPSAARKLLKQCEPFAQDTEGAQTAIVSDGLDAGVAVLEVLSSCIDDDPEHAIDASIAATDTVDRHIQIADGVIIRKLILRNG